MTTTRRPWPCSIPRDGEDDLLIRDPRGVAALKQFRREGTITPWGAEVLYNHRVAAKAMRDLAKVLDTYQATRVKGN